MAEPPRVREPHASVRERGLSVWGLLYRRLQVGSDVSQIEFQGQKGIERGFMLLTPGWCAELNESHWNPLPLGSDNVPDGADTITHTF